ncbi:MAG TPA: type II toxin-antitoxin system VapC family toxin, partial [Actinomycetota bacterium]|nr:type II toxin-antitoxin system VapC family toxin [Actinomycetota bacterium]
MLDASAIGEYLLRTELGLQVETIIEEPDARLNVPAICDVEVCSALRRTIRSGELQPSQAVEALAVYLALPITRYGHTALVGRIFELRDNFAASDAAYVALCEQLSATLVTCDNRLTRLVQQRLPLNVIG